MNMLSFSTCSSNSIVAKHSYYARFQSQVPSKIQRGSGRGRLMIHSVRSFQQQQSLKTVVPMYPMFIPSSSTSVGTASRTSIVSTTTTGTTCSSQVRHFTESSTKKDVFSSTTLTTTAATTTNNNNSEDPFWKKNLITIASIVSAAGVSAAMMILYNRTNNKEYDPYENLPEEDDENVACIYCIAFLKSPCRTYFRKLNKCRDDNKNSKNMDDICERYQLPFHKCLQQNINRVLLIVLDENQKLVESLQNDVEISERRCWVGNNTTTTTTTATTATTATTVKSPIQIDWGELGGFVQENGTDFNQFNQLPIHKDTISTTDTASSSSSSSSSTAERIPLWKQCPEDTEPILFYAAAKYIPREIEIVTTTKDDSSPNLMLSCAWVVDQDDMNLGYEPDREFYSLHHQARQQQKEKGQTDKVEEENDKHQITHNNNTNNNTTNNNNNEKEKEKEKEKSSSIEEEVNNDNMINNQEKVENVETINETDSFFTLPFTFIPGITKEVRVFARYEENPLIACNNEGKEPFIVLFHSEPYSLIEAAEASAATAAAADAAAAAKETN